MQNSASASPSAVWKSFLTPGNVVDFPTDPARQAEMNQLWNDNVAGWLTAALTGDVWDLVNYGPRPAFYDPLTTGTPADAALAPIPWNAFPARISVMFPDQPTKWNEWADTGDLPQITQNLCTGPIAATPYTPTGPRGWQDEYCEWSVRRDPDTQEILSIMFTCENPEYWLTLWRVSPQAVLAVYRQLVNPAVTLDDLSLTDSQGFVTDPANGNQRVYNPLNKWNRGTQTLPTSGGAMHLTSSPNTLGAEYDLAAAATMPRVSGTGQPITSSQPLICCAKYGRPGRHSDPTIGVSVNATVNDGSGNQVLATLTNPPGLYMQTPDWTLFSSNVIADPQQFAASCWTVVRGRLADPSIPGDIDRILHATFTVPPGTKASDLLVNGQPLTFGSQVTAAITMKLSATAFSTSAPAQTGVACTDNAVNPAPSINAIQSANVFQAYRALELQMDELPLSIPILAYRLSQGTEQQNVALALNVDVPDPPQKAEVTIQGGGVNVQITGQTAAPGGVAALLATITVSADATAGPRGVVVTIPGLPSIPQPALGLFVVDQASNQLSSARTAPKPRLRFGRS